MDVLIAYSVPVFLGLLALEWFATRRGTDPLGRPVRGYEPRDTAASLAMGLGNVVIAGVAKGGAVWLYMLAYEWRVFDLVETVGMAAAWPLLILSEDLCYYAFHRAHHEVRFLWAAHVNHHSSERYNLSTALRQSWSTPFTGPWFWVPLALVGFPPLMILTAQAISLVYQFWIHTECVGRLGSLEAIFNTPSHHRVHHGSNTRYLDRNHAGIFIVWDRLFGTFEPEIEPVHYGLTTNLHTFNPWRIAWHEWIAIARDVRGSRSWVDALGYALRPPGWSPDGSTLTANQRRRAEAIA